jgi:hypothetical protein
MRNKLLPFCILVALLALVLAACSGKSHDAAPTTSTPPPPTTAATTQASLPDNTTPNPDVIPPVITVAYVNAVFAVLNHLNGDAVRALVASRQVTPTVKLYLRAAYNDPLYAEEVKIAQQSIDGDLSNVRQPPGDIVTTVERLVSASPTCIFAETRSEFSQVLVRPGSPAAAEYFSLTPKHEANDPRDLNSTPWGFTFNADYQAPTAIPSQCPASQRPQSFF